MKQFDEALGFILIHEGGYSNNPLDSGGPTKYGISTSFLIANGISKKVEELSFSEAKKIYEAYFWNPFAMDRFNDKIIRLYLFDSAINCGKHKASEFLQTAINYLTPIEIDGKIGPKTTDAVNKLCSSIDRKLFIDLLIIVRASYYLSIVKHSPEKRVFLKGWMNRVRDLKETFGSHQK